MYGDDKQVVGTLID
jgi:hypothetical protein